MFRHNWTIKEALAPDEDGVCRFSIYWAHKMRGVKKDNVCVISAPNGQFLGKIVDELELDDGLFEYTIEAAPDDNLHPV